MFFRRVSADKEKGFIVRRVAPDTWGRKTSVLEDETMSVKKIGTIGLGLLLCASLSGCLVIGGKTHVCTNSKEADERIAVLENRIQTLEQYAGITPPKTNDIAVASATLEAK